MASGLVNDGGGVTRRIDGEADARRIDLYRRALDVVVSMLLLLVVLPVLIVTMMASAITLRAWPLFTQDRVGRDGRTFRFLKIRTLPVDMPDYADKHQLDHDRIPALCALLRRLHLDELPQLLLVLRGHMSLVGPRPEMRYLHELMPGSFAELRTSVRPGCTGLWQISEACTELIGVAPEYDRAYLAQRTLRFDLWVLFRTTLKMLGVGRPVTLADVPRWVGTHDHVIETITLPEAIVLSEPDRAEGRRAEQLSLPIGAGR